MFAGLLATLVPYRLLIGVSLAAAILGGVWYHGYSHANDKNAAARNAEMAQAVVDYQSREAENVRHRDKARALNAKIDTDFRAAVPAESDRLYNLINRANSTALAACSRDATGSGADQGADQSDRSATQRRLDEIGRVNSDAIALLKSDSRACAAKIDSFAATLEAVER